MSFLGSYGQLAGGAHWNSAATGPCDSQSALRRQPNLRPSAPWQSHSSRPRRACPNGYKTPPGSREANRHAPSHSRPLESCAPPGVLDHARILSRLRRLDQQSDRNRPTARRGGCACVASGGFSLRSIPDVLQKPFRRNLAAEAGALSQFIDLASNGEELRAL